MYSEYSTSTWMLDVLRSTMYNSVQCTRYLVLYCPNAMKGFVSASYLYSVVLRYWIRLARTLVSTVVVHSTPYVYHTGNVSLEYEHPLCSTRTRTCSITVHTGGTSTCTSYCTPSISNPMRLFCVVLNEVDRINNGGDRQLVTPRCHSL